MTFGRNFFSRHPLAVARDLIGAKLTTKSQAGLTSGMIIEVEAYSSDDPASHSFSGQSNRNRSMFLEGGHCYVYFIYGVHYCVNVVTESKHIGSAVLIRAVAPEQGIEIMQKRRNTTSLKKLTDGPGKLCQAFGIDKSFDGEDFLRSKRIFLEENKYFRDSEVVYSPRIGVSKAKSVEWRVFLK